MGLGAGATHAVPTIIKQKIETQRITNRMLQCTGITAQINTAIQQVAQNAQSVTQEAGKANASALDGAQKVKSRIFGSLAPIP